MADEKEIQEEVPRWRLAQEESIRRATALVKEHGPNVEFLVIKDKQFLAETVRPIENIDEAMDYLYRLEGRGINSEDIAKFKSGYSLMCEQIKVVEDIAVELLSKAKVRTKNQNLNRKVQKLRNKKPESAKVEADAAEIKTEIISKDEKEVIKKNEKVKAS